LSQDRKHLKRLGMIYENHPRYFITVCVHNRKKLLAQDAVRDVLCCHWAKSLDLYGWAIGSYVIMPDHVHFFCTDAAGTSSLSRMVGAWKQWTAKELCLRFGIERPLWQKEFFDHLIRSSESYSEKWEYVRNNPVRAGLVEHSDDWKYVGHIDYS